MSEERICVECGKPYTPKRAGGVYCCAYCRYKAWDKRNPRIRSVGVKPAELGPK